MLKTILLLLLGFVVLPFAAWHYDAPLGSTQSEMLKNAFIAMSIVALVCFVTSELTGNCSQVDKLWSIMPVIYSWYFASVGNWDPRMTLMAALVTIWGLRLTFNFWRRGGYHWIPWKGEEDYRWSVLRKQPLLQGKWSWRLFNFFFISFYQQGLILLFTLPAVLAWSENGEPLNMLDWVAAAIMLVLIGVETIADQQQYDFQTEKHRRLRSGEKLDGDCEQGFCTKGLWAKVRHPNYAAEQGIWLAFYLFSVPASDRWLNGSLTGAVLLMLLFLGSSDFSEKISAGKYPAYAHYQKSTGRFFPRLWPGR
jgi:steroid 5-alpha reductase family enzyme